MRFACRLHPADTRDGLNPERELEKKQRFHSVVSLQREAPRPTPPDFRPQYNAQSPRQLPTGVKGNFEVKSCVDFKKFFSHHLLAKHTAAIKRYLELL